MTLACKDAILKLVEVVTVADVDDENRVGKFVADLEAEVCQLNVDSLHSIIIQQAASSLLNGS